MLPQASNSKRGVGSFRNRLAFAAVLVLIFLLGNENAILQAKEPDITDSNAVAFEPIASVAVPAKPQTGLPTTTMRIGTRVYHLEVAATPEQAEKGLMYRTSLPPYQGMLFLFQPAHAVKFWMKNTKIPLDMLFLSQGKVTFIQSSAPPCLADPCAIYGPDTPVDMVVELSAGTAKKHNIGLGSRVVVRWPDISKAAALQAASWIGK